MRGSLAVVATILIRTAVQWPHHSASQEVKRASFVNTNVLSFWIGIPTTIFQQRNFVDDDKKALKTKHLRIWSLHKIVFKKILWVNKRTSALHFLCASLETQFWIPNAYYTARPVFAQCQRLLFLVSKQICKQKYPFRKERFTICQKIWVLILPSWCTLRLPFPVQLIFFFLSQQ